MTYFANRITGLFLENGIIDKENEPIYVYGAELLLNFLTIFILLIVLGAFMGQITNTLIFASVCILIRACGGGYHASAFLKCCAVTTGVYLAVIFLSFLEPAVKNILFPPFILIGDIILFFTAPSQNVNNPRTADEIKVFRSRTLVCVLLINIFSIVSRKAGLFGETYFVICCTLLTTALLSLINYLQNSIKEGRVVK